MKISTIQETEQILREMGIGSSRQRQMLVGMCLDIIKRVQRHFEALQISPYNPKATRKRDYTPGELYRTIHWTVFNATGGDEEKVKFYTQNIMTFVELAVQRDYGLDKGGMPPLINQPNYRGIHVNRGPKFKRPAKPFLAGEMRVHARMFFDRMVRDYGYMGNIVMLSAVLPNKWTAAKDMAAMRLEGWQGDLTSFRLDDE